MSKLKEWFQKETVLCIALLLAVISSFVVFPDREYLTYIDFHTLAILFCLMCVMAGLQKLGVFSLIARKLLGTIKSSSQLEEILIFLCFFFSMLITNDVALITFVPFTFTVLELLGEEKQRRMAIPIVVLQTIAANLGSMFTPIGNPQNLYLYGQSGMSLIAFLKLMLPYTLLSFLLLLFACFLLGRKEKSAPLEVAFPEKQSLSGKGKKLVAYFVLFVLCLLTVADLISVWITLGVVLIVQLILDREVLKRVDYSLLLTFVGFFVFIGNMGRVPAFSEVLQRLVKDNEVVTAVLSSQVISNVPAALLLSGFTDNYKELVIGTNLGGLGTLIASMASLISYKYVAKESEKAVIGTKGKYLFVFTLANVGFLAVLTLAYVVINVI
ncbi:MAG: citrate transporter [Lachnospiraceae bacterium]|nr:citrate transporter [Lachnospiraceae bacterium]